MTESTRYGKTIRTRSGKYLFCVKVNDREFFGYMLPNGKRVVSVHEQNRGKYLNEQEWVHALATWDNPAVVDLTSSEIVMAEYLAVKMASDFTHGMTPEQKSKLPKGYMRCFN